MLPSPDEAEQKKGGPVYLTAYSSIMTLLLAFFIILQALGPKQQEGLFFRGQGSFIRALATFGLGGLWQGEGGSMLDGVSGPAYLAPEGADSASGRSIDPEMERAQKALEELRDRYDVSEPEEGSGWRVTLSTPFTDGVLDGEFTADDEQFCAQLARRLRPLVLARGFVIRVGSVVHGGGSAALRDTQRALEGAAHVRRRLIANMGGDLGGVEGRIYTFCRREEAEPGAETPRLDLRIDILLTKPFRHEAATEENAEA